jgi:hypothetical protein
VGTANAACTYNIAGAGLTTTKKGTFSDTQTHNCSNLWGLASVAAGTTITSGPVKLFITATDWDEVNAMPAAHGGTGSTSIESVACP